MSDHTMSSYMTADAIEAVGPEVFLRNRVTDVDPAQVEPGDHLVVRTLDGCVFQADVVAADPVTLRVRFV